MNAREPLLTINLFHKGAPMLKTDTQLKTDIEQELKADPSINALQIGVTVDHGAVTLLGEVETYAAKWAAETATKRVSGVRTVAQDLTVKLLQGDQRTDSDVAAAVENVLRWNVYVPMSVTATVQNGVVTLSGEVAWNYEREAAGKAVRYLTGVSLVNNAITLKERPTVEKVQDQVTTALLRQATTDAHSIKIETSGGRVTLSGHATSWQSIEDATNAAWAVPGVTKVVDHISLR